ncbi:MAG TPA: MATE family efflux transporter [Polyangiaceae bacterium]|nr:MATE family efflux transporter [Polyangiaceae bacterium]
MSATAEPDARTQRILHGPLPLEVLRFGAPIALGMGLQTAFNLVDAYIIARLPRGVSGPSLGAIGICDQLAALGTIASYGVSVAAASLVSRAWGRGDQAGARRIAWQSSLLVLALGFVLALVGGLGASSLLTTVIGVKGQVAARGADYLTVVMGGSITMFLMLHCASLLRAVGSSKTPVVLLLLGNALNFVLAVLFVYGAGQAPELLSWGPPVARSLGLPRLELFGAGVATLLARALVVLPLLFFAAQRLGFWRRAVPLVPDRALLRQVLGLAWPSSAELLVRMSAMLLTHALVARAFTTATDQSATTALGIVFRFETMALFISIGWGSAVQTFVGQNLGARSVVRAKRSGYWAAIYNSAMMALLALVYVTYAGRIVGFFDADVKVLGIAQSYLAWVAPSYVALGVGIVLGSVMQGAGAPRLALLIDACVVLFVQVPASALVLSAPTPSLIQVWLVVGLSYVALAIALLARYRHGSFLRSALA